MADAADPNPDEFIFPTRQYFEIPPRTSDDEIPKFPEPYNAPLQRIDFLVRLVGFIANPNRDSMFAVVIFLDEDMWVSVEFIEYLFWLYHNYLFRLLFYLTNLTRIFPGNSSKGQARNERRL